MFFVGFRSSFQSMAINNIIAKIRIVGMLNWDMSYCLLLGLLLAALASALGSV